MSDSENLDQAQLRCLLVAQHLTDDLIKGDLDKNVRTSKLLLVSELNRIAGNIDAVQYQLERLGKGAGG